MKIGLDAKRAFNNGTGLGNYSRFVISGLVKHFPEHEYYLFTPSVKNEYQNFVAAAPNIRIVSAETSLGKAFPALWRTYSIADRCIALGLDVFHGLSNELPIGIEKFKGRKIVTIHDLIFMRYPAYYNNIDRYIYQRKFRHACERADTIAAASQQTNDDILQHFHTDAQKIRVTYQDCDPAFGVAIPEDQRQVIKTRYSLPSRYILCVGTPEPRKNQLNVIKAFAQLADSHTNLVIVGKRTEYAKKLEEFVTGNGLEKRVRFLYEVKHDDLPAIYQLATLFVYASEFEGFGIPLLEAMRSGLPTLSANSSSLPEVAGEAALYFDFNNPSELADKMRVLLQDENIRKRMLQDAADQLRKFDSHVLMRQLMEIYTS